jgi:hypothetical protein
MLTALAAASTIVTAHAAVIMDSLMVRVYDTAGVLAGDRAHAMRVAGKVMATARIDIEWRDCTPGAAARPAPECDAVPRQKDLLLRIGRAPSGTAAGAARSLGYSLIDVQSHRGSLATVYLDRIDWLAGEARVPSIDLLGRAIAHELGHLVLGTNGHSKGGLMRAVWTAAEVERNKPSDWTFSPADRAGLLTAWRGEPGPPAS